jgi:hypothetical protein
MAGKQKGANLRLRYNWSEEALVQHLWDDNGRIRLSVLEILSEVAPEGFETDLICDLLELIAELESAGTSPLEIARQILHQVRPVSDEDAEFVRNTPPRPSPSEQNVVGVRACNEATTPTLTDIVQPPSWIPVRLTSVGGPQPLSTAPLLPAPRSRPQESQRLSFNCLADQNPDIAEPLSISLGESDHPTCAFWFTCVDSLVPSISEDQMLSSRLAFLRSWLGRIFPQPTKSRSSGTFCVTLQPASAPTLATLYSQVKRPLDALSRIDPWFVTTINAYPTPGAEPADTNTIDPNQLQLWSD